MGSAATAEHLGPQPKLETNKSKDLPNIPAQMLQDYFETFSVASLTNSFDIEVIEKRQALRGQITAFVTNFLLTKGEYAAEELAIIGTYMERFDEIFRPTGSIENSLSYSYKRGEELNEKGERFDNGAMVLDIAYSLDHEGKIVDYTRQVLVPASSWIRDRDQNGNVGSINLAEVYIVDFCGDQVGGNSLCAQSAEKAVDEILNDSCLFGPEQEFYLPNHPAGDVILADAQIELGRYQREIAMPPFSNFSDAQSGIARIIFQVMSKLNSLGTFADMAGVPSAEINPALIEINPVSTYVQRIADDLLRMKVLRYIGMLPPQVIELYKNILEETTDYSDISAYLGDKGILIWMLNSVHGNMPIAKSETGAVFPKEIQQESSLYSYFSSIINAPAHSGSAAYGHSLEIQSDKVLDARSALNVLFYSAQPSTNFEPGTIELNELIRESVLAGHANLPDRAVGMIANVNEFGERVITTSTHGDYRARFTNLWARMRMPDLIIGRQRSEYTGRSATPDIRKLIESIAIQYVLHFAGKLSLSEGKDIVDWMNSQGYHGWGSDLYSYDTIPGMQERLDAACGKFDQKKICEIGQLAEAVEVAFNQRMQNDPEGKRIPISVTMPIQQTVKFAERLLNRSRIESSFDDFSRMSASEKYDLYMQDPDQFYSYGEFVSMMTTEEMEEVLLEKGFLIMDKGLIHSAFNHLVTQDTAEQVIGHEKRG